MENFNKKQMVDFEDLKESLVNQVDKENIDFFKNLLNEHGLNAEYLNGKKGSLSVLNENGKKLDVFFTISREGKDPNQIEYSLEIADNLKPFAENYIQFEGGKPLDKELIRESLNNNLIKREIAVLEGVKDIVNDLLLQNEIIDNHQKHTSYFLTTAEQLKTLSDSFKGADVVVDFSKDESGQYILDLKTNKNVDLDVQIKLKSDPKNNETAFVFAKKGEYIDEVNVQNLSKNIKGLIEESKNNIQRLDKESLKKAFNSTLTKSVLKNKVEAIKKGLQQENKLKL